MEASGTGHPASVSERPQNQRRPPQTWAGLRAARRAQEAEPAGDMMSVVQLEVGLKRLPAAVGNLMLGGGEGIGVSVKLMNHVLRDTCPRSG